MVRDLETAEDLAQEAFGRAFVGLRGFRREASSRTWILSIARNLCIDHLRAQRREPSTGGRLEGSEPDHQPDDSPLPSDLVARRHQLKAALDGLAEVDRALVVLRYRHGLEYLELAEVFGLRAGTIRMRLSRALARMRAELERAVPEAVAQPRRMAPAGPAYAPDVPKPPFARRVSSPLEAEPKAEELEEELTPPAGQAPAVLERPPAGPAPSRPPPIPGAAPSRRPPLAEPQRRPVSPARRPSPALPTPPPASAPAHAMGEALELLDPGLPLGLFERLLETVSSL
jgi:RNA polymerase sigma-70 factor, ECF subfamily